MVLSTDLFSLTEATQSAMRTRGLAWLEVPRWSELAGGGEVIHGRMVCRATGRVEGVGRCADISDFWREAHRVATQTDWLKTVPSGACRDSLVAAE